MDQGWVKSAANWITTQLMGWDKAKGYFVPPGEFGERLAHYVAPLYRNHEFGA